MGFTDNELALNSGQWVGFGLRQSQEIIPTFITGIVDGGAFCEVSLESNAGEVVEKLYMGYGTGIKLNLEMEDAKVGGLIEGRLTILKKNNIPFFNGMLVKIYIKSVKWFTGYIDGIPETDDSTEQMILKITGFVKKLKTKKVNKSYAVTTVKDIIIDLSSEIAETDINFNLSKIADLTTVISVIEFNDKSLFEVFNRLRQISNLDYDNTRYNFGVDAEKDFYFLGVDFDEAQKGYFEGFHFQNPKVTKNTVGMINSVSVYRTQSADIKKTEFDETYEDTESQDEFGLFQEKLTISDYVDDTTAENIAKAILAEFAVARKRVVVQNLITTEKLANGFYNITNKPEFQKFTIDECSDVSNWSLASVGTILFQTSIVSVLTGRRCFDFNINTSLGAILTREFDRHYTITKAVFYVRSETIENDLLKFTFTGKTTDRLILKANGKTLLTDENKYIKIHTPSRATQDYTVSIPLTNEWVKLEFDLSHFYYLDKMDIEVLNDNVVNLKFDRFDIHTNSPYTNFLEYEKAKYILNDNSLLASVEFGDTEPDLVDEILKLSDKNQIAGDIFAKTE